MIFLVQRPMVTIKQDKVTWTNPGKELTLATTQWTEMKERHLCRITFSAEIPAITIPVQYHEAVKRFRHINNTTRIGTGREAGVSRSSVREISFRLRRIINRAISLFPTIRRLPFLLTRSLCRLIIAFSHLELKIRITGTLKSLGNTIGIIRRTRRKWGFDYFIYLELFIIEIVIIYFEKLYDWSIRCKECRTQDFRKSTKCKEKAKPRNSITQYFPADFDSVLASNKFLFPVIT